VVTQRPRRRPQAPRPARRRAATLPSRRCRVAARSLDETLSVTRTGVRGRLKRELVSTNPCESMIEMSSSSPARRRYVPALDRRRRGRSRAPVRARRRPRRPRQARRHSRERRRHQTRIHVTATPTDTLVTA
jgi:hypothetical protein